MTFRIAVVQRISHRPDEDERNVAGPQWRRPQLYDTFYPRPLREAAG